MSTIAARPRARTTRSLLLTAGGLLAVGGTAFVAGGMLHPGDSGEGSKPSQLIEMLVDPMWYPSHLLLLASLACFAAGTLALARGGPLTSRMRTLTGVLGGFGVLATLAMVVHMLEPVGDHEQLATGTGLSYQVAVWNEILVSGGWGLGVVVLAVAGGLTGTLGNRFTMLFGAVGGAAFALAATTVPFTDRFDQLFMVGGPLIGLWAVTVGVMVARSRP